MTHPIDRLGFFEKNKYISVMREHARVKKEDPFQYWLSEVLVWITHPVISFKSRGMHREFREWEKENTDELDC